MPSDGKWTITPTTTASYKTRIIVRRPANPAHFNGTVIVEWMNVSAGESAPDWDFLNPMLMRDGYAYVGVSAQKLGVDGGSALLGSPGSSAPNTGLVGDEPARYGSLHHPGDQYALDMYAQIGQALRAPHQKALGGLKPKHILAVGESQSAFYLTTFADAIQPLTNTYDGIFIHSRGGSGASLAGTSIASSSGPDNLRIRTDLKVPVFMSQTQTDLIQLGYAPAQQPNTAKIRTWEIAGTAHADAYTVGAAASLLGCTTPVNSGPQHNVVQAAFTAFDKWVDDGTPPPSPPPFTLSSTHPAALALDAHGNVIGGVRTPAVDVPVSTLSGAPAPGPTPSAPSSGRPSRSPRPSSPASTAPRATTSPSTRRAWTRRSPRGTSSARTRPHSWRRPSRCSSPPERTRLRGHRRRQRPTRPVRRRLPPVVGLPGLIEPEHRQPGVLALFSRQPPAGAQADHPDAADEARDVRHHLHHPVFFRHQLDLPFSAGSHGGTGWVGPMPQS